MERFDRDVSELFLVQQEISDAIVGCLQMEIEAAEQKRALMRPDQTLDAWSAYHRGVWHMNRFNPADFNAPRSSSSARSSWNLTRHASMRDCPS